MMSSNRKNERPVAFSYLPLPPSKIDLPHLFPNGKLLPDELISELLRLIKKEGRYSKKELTRKYPILAALQLSIAYTVDPKGKTHLFAIYHGAKLNKVIGRGAFGGVKYAQDLKTGEVVAAKVISGKKRQATKPQAVKELEESVDSTNDEDNGTAVQNEDADAEEAIAENPLWKNEEESQSSEYENLTEMGQAFGQFTQEKSESKEANQQWIFMKLARGVSLADYLSLDEKLAAQLKQELQDEVKTSAEITKEESDKLLRQIMYDKLKEAMQKKLSQQYSQMKAQELSRLIEEKLDDTLMKKVEKQVRKELKKEFPNLERKEIDEMVDAKIVVMGSKELDRRLEKPLIEELIKILSPEELHKRLESLKTLTLKQAVNIVISILQAFAEMHDKRLIHRDIKPDNILFNENDMTINLVDFGLSYIMKKHHEIRATASGTPGWVDPEINDVLQEMNASTEEKIDKWHKKLQKLQLMGHDLIKSYNTLEVNGQWDELMTIGQTLITQFISLKKPDPLIAQQIKAWEKELDSFFADLKLDDNPALAKLRKTSSKIIKRLNWNNLKNTQGLVAFSEKTDVYSIALVIEFIMEKVSEEELHQYPTAQRMINENHQASIDPDHNNRPSVKESLEGYRAIQQEIGKNKKIVCLIGFDEIKKMLDSPENLALLKEVDEGIIVAKSDIPILELIKYQRELAEKGVRVKDDAIILKPGMRLEEVKDELQQQDSDFAIYTTFDELDTSALKSVINHSINESSSASASLNNNGLVLIDETPHSDPVTIVADKADDPWTELMEMQSDITIVTVKADDDPWTELMQMQSDIIDDEITKEKKIIERVKNKNQTRDGKDKNARAALASVILDALDNSAHTTTARLDILRGLLHEELKKPKRKIVSHLPFWVLTPKAKQERMLVSHLKRLEKLMGSKVEFEHEITQATKSHRRQ